MDRHSEANDENFVLQNFYDWFGLKNTRIDDKSFASKTNVIITIMIQTKHLLPSLRYPEAEDFHRRINSISPKSHWTKRKTLKHLMNLKSTSHRNLGHC